MKGTRPLSEAEIRKVSGAFSGTYEVRNRSLFWLGITSGGRITELLSLVINDVYQNGAPVRDLLFDKNIVKGGEVSRAVPLNADGQTSIQALIRWHQERYHSVDNARPLFPSRQGNEVSMTRQLAHGVLKTAFEKAGLNGKLATHSLRKTYAQRLYSETGDVFCVKEMLGHQNVATTQAYLGVDYQKVRSASDALVLRGTVKTSENGIGEISDEKLLIELASRGYDITAIVKRKEGRR